MAEYLQLAKSLCINTIVLYTCDFYVLHLLHVLQCGVAYFKLFWVIVMSLIVSSELLLQYNNFDSPVAPALCCVSFP